MSSEVCQFPLCSRKSERSGMCFLHAAKMGMPVLPADPKLVNKRSDKMKDVYKVYKKILRAYMARPGNKNCAIKMDGCTGLAECVHHTEGRIGDKLLDESTYMPSCYHCNIEVECKDGIARAKGFKKSKFTPVLIKGDEVNGTNILIAEAVSLKPT